MRTISAAVIVALCLCVVAAATPPGLIIAPDGYYAVTIGADGKPVQEKITQVMVFGTPPVTPPGGTPVPPASGLSAKIAAMSKVKVPDAGEGTALAAGVNTVLKMMPASATPAQIETAMSSVVTVIGGSVNAKTRVDAWYAALKAIEGFTFSRAGLDATLAGLISAYDIDPNILKSVVDAAVTAEANNVPAEKAAAALETQFANAAFDFTAILSIIMAIIELLRNLGIFGV